LISIPFIKCENITICESLDRNNGWFDLTKFTFEINSNRYFDNLYGCIKQKCWIININSDSSITIIGDYDTSGDNPIDIYRDSNINFIEDNFFTLFTIIGFDHNAVSAQRIARDIVFYNVFVFE
jgi:hypothetical protein